MITNGIDPETMVSGDTAWMLLCSALVLLMTPALALFYGGMSRQKSAINMMLMSFGGMAVAGVLFITVGWSMSYGSQSIAGIFANPFELFGLNDSIFDDVGHFLVGAHGYINTVDIRFQITFAMIAVCIISGSLDSYLAHLLRHLDRRLLFANGPYGLGWRMARRRRAQFGG